ncbi:MAG: translocation/assembly module TamB domain-containing protein, partial [Aquificaceae bacterium]
PLKGKISLREGESLQALFEGFTTGKNLISIKVGSIKVYGDLKEGFIKVQPATLWLGREVLSRVEFKRGSYKNKGFQLDGKVLGVLEGSLKVVYDQGFQAYSEGFLDLGRLFSLIRSRAFGDGEGKVLYRFSYEGDGINLKAKGEKLVLRSRYLALPLEGSIELSMKENKLKGGVKFYGNQRASIVGSLEGDSKGAKVNFEVSQLPVLLREENLRASLAFSGKGYIQSHYKNLSIGGDFYTSGLINLQKLTTKKAAPSEDYKRVSLDLKITSSDPLRINLPEGYIYTDLLVNVKGSLYEPEYKINAYLKGGNLNYFGKNFYVRRGEVFFTKKEQNLDLTLITPTPDYSIIIDIKGNPQYPKAVVRSEPPRDTREVLTTFVLGGKETEGLIPVASAIVSQVPQLTDFFKGANQLTGLDVKIQASPTLSPTGEVGINTTISKEITERIHLEHRQSTLKNPKETYTSGEVKLTPNTSIGGRLYSDKSQEYKVRLRKKFNF